MKTQQRPSWIVRLAFLALLALLAALFSCNARTATQIVVRVETDIPDLRNVRIQATREPLGAGETAIFSELLSVAGDASLFPLEKGIVSGSTRDTRPVRITVTADEGIPGAEFTIAQLFPFEVASVLRVRVFLAQGCRSASVRAVCERQGLLCGAGGRCVAPDIQRLDPSNGSTSEASVEASVVATVDAAGVDAADGSDGGGVDGGETSVSDVVDAAPAVDALEGGDVTDVVDVVVMDAADAAAVVDVVDAADVADAAVRVDVIDVGEAGDACVASVVCTPPNVCRTGATQCGSDGPACVETGSLLRGVQPVGCNGTQACDGSGTCGVCGSLGQPCCGSTCTPAAMCDLASHSCVMRRCMLDVDCGEGRVCNPTTGACFACSDGASCPPSNVCQTGTQRCSSGALVCQASGSVARAAQPTGCSGAQACDGSGTCATCGAIGQPCCGGACASGGMCDNSAGTCVLMRCTASTQCGPGELCNTTTATCYACSPGAACALANVCQTATQECGSGVRVCTVRGNVARATQPTECTGTQACDGSGACVACGGVGQPCCGSTCSAGNACIAGTCAAQTCPSGYLFIPAGDYVIGSDASDPNRLTNEYPQWTAALSGYCMKRTEVTVAEFRACRTAGRCLSDPTTGTDFNWNVSGRDNHPINGVDWNQAADYCAWSSGRLPTEAEWEAAARGATWRLYPWGTVAPTDALTNFSNNNGGTQEVALPGQDRCNNPFGLCDMSGNVWEWVNDWYGTYPTGRQVDPTGAASGSNRVGRGGAWNYSPAGMRASYRFSSLPTTRSSLSGFRCVRSVM